MGSEGINRKELNRKIYRENGTTLFRGGTLNSMRVREKTSPASREKGSKGITQ